MEGLDQKQLFAECAPKPEGLWERELFALMHQSGQAMVGAVSEAQAAQREYREYVEQWVHEIKTPITAARLISRTVGPDTRRRLERELLHGGQPDDEEPERAPAMFRDRYDTGYRDGYDDAVESLQFANLPQRPRKGKHKRKAAAGNMVRAELPERPIVMEHQHGA